MKISTKGQYALEIMIDMAIYTDESTPESLKNIASRRGLSEKYLERIMKSLKNKGLINSARGAKGGYSLARPAEEITVLEVLEASEGRLSPVECLVEDVECGIAYEKCPTRCIWNDMWQEILRVAGSETIGGLAALASDKIDGREGEDR